MAESLDAVGSLEVSAKSGSGVNTMFEVLAKKIIAQYYTEKQEEPNDGVTVISTARSAPNVMTECCCVS